MFSKYTSQTNLMIVFYVRINKNKKVAFADLEDVRFIKKKKKGFLSNPFKKVQKGAKTIPCKQFFNYFKPIAKDDENVRSNLLSSRETLGEVERQKDSGGERL